MSEPPLSILSERLPPQHSYWGDLVVAPGGDTLYLPLRGRGLAALREEEVVRVPGAPAGSRLRALDSRGRWLVSHPDRPHAIHALDLATGQVQAEFVFPGRFDPDTRLHLRALANGELLMLGCGVPGLLRFDAEGRVLADYYGLSEAHRRDFAWRGTVCVAQRPSDERLYLLDGHMYGVILIIDPERGQTGEIGTRCEVTMGAPGPVWIESLADGRLAVLHVEPARLVLYAAGGEVLGTHALPVEPWHALSTPQFRIVGGAIELLARTRGETRVTRVGLW